jgi:hypothetical protein
MSNIRLVTDLAECHAVWEQLVPRQNLTDLWEVRECFQRHFRRPACFLVAEDRSGLRGLLPLSWIDEHGYYGLFPGETWAGKTWLEQNRAIAQSDDVLDELLSRCPGRYHLRYLSASESAPRIGRNVDEIGYLFHPPQYGYDLGEYFSVFSHKSAKRLRTELVQFEVPGVTYRHEDLDDFDRLVDMNVGRFGEGSYFHDVRFRESFRSLLHLFRDRGWLRLTAVLIGGELAAVDIGCLHENTYTLLGGGTHPGYPGVAKLINIHHMNRACEERIGTVDFLCGDFSWKKLFHLTPRPLHLISNAVIAHPEAARHSEAVGIGSETCVR